jgi:predicted RNase H-like nuclease (RuvC/YqgF family)
MKDSEDRSSLDLTFLIDKHKREIWAYKQKESTWEHTRNELENSKDIITQLTSDNMRLKEDVRQLKNIIDMHEAVNTALQSKVSDKKSK